MFIYFISNRLLFKLIIIHVQVITRCLQIKLTRKNVAIFLNIIHDKLKNITYTT